MHQQQYINEIEPVVLDNERKWDKSLDLLPNEAWQLSIAGQLNWNLDMDANVLKINCKTDNKIR